MWFTIVFAISLVGLVALFACKSLELSMNVRTPLLHLRRVGDPLLAEGWAYYSSRFKRASVAGFRVCLLWLRSVLQKTEATFDATVHTIATRLNKYLRTRRLHRHHGSEVSMHLKTVLEKTEQKTTE